MNLIQNDAMVQDALTSNLVLQEYENKDGEFNLCIIHRNAVAKRS